MVHLFINRVHLFNIDPPVRKQEQQNAPMMKRVCAYCRVSTASGEQKHSLETQIRYYTKLIQEKEHWIWAGIYADEA